MKARYSLKGNVKITLTEDQTHDLYRILDMSHMLKDMNGQPLPARVEVTSNRLFDKLYNMGFRA